MTDTTEGHINLDIKSGIIKDEEGRMISVDRARELWESKKIRKCNRYFFLLIRCEFNLGLTQTRFKGWKKKDHIMTLKFKRKTQEQDGIKNKFAEKGVVASGIDSG